MKKTIAEKRTIAAVELANRTTGNVANAKKAMNAYYRLCGLEERLLYLENNEKLATLITQKSSRSKKKELSKE